uniref:Uncharacterized protein n=1 Tax=Glossina palpalis gambiensis TaxID=67801 RepID=A0A1B0AUS8_9MUSC
MGVLRWRDLPGSRVSVGNHHNNNTANNQNNNHSNRGEVSRHFCIDISVRLYEIKTAKVTGGANVPGYKSSIPQTRIMRDQSRPKYFSVTVIGMLQKIVKYLVNLGCGYDESGIASPVVGRLVRLQCTEICTKNSTK